MEGVRAWIVRYKKMLILMGAAGMMLAPFLWPFFLAILFQTFSLAVPILVVGFAVKKLRREKPDEQKGNQEYKSSEDADVHSEKAVSGCKAPKGAENGKTDPVPERYWETGEKSLRKQLKSRKEMSDASCLALIGYRRIGVLRSYPFREMKGLIPRLRKDHIHTSQRGKYLWLSWGKECLR